MISFDDFVALRQRLVTRSDQPEWSMLSRYDLLREKPDLRWRDRVYRTGRSFLASLGWVTPYLSKYIWLASLKHQPASPEARIVLIWAVDCLNREELRLACRGFCDRLTKESGLLPVLLTNVADFGAYSRLGWLVEYLPALSGDGDSYAARKCRYLAWRYRAAIVVPLSAGLASAEEWKKYLKNGLA